MTPTRKPIGCLSRYKSGTAIGAVKVTLVCSEWLFNRIPRRSGNGGYPPNRNVGPSHPTYRCWHDGMLHFVSPSPLHCVEALFVSLGYFERGFLTLSQTVRKSLEDARGMDTVNKTFERSTKNQRQQCGSVTFLATSTRP